LSGTYTRRATVIEEVVKGKIWTCDQIQGVVNVNVPVRMVVVKVRRPHLVFGRVSYHRRRSGNSESFSSFGGGAPSSSCEEIRRSRRVFLVAWMDGRHVTR
jgi:hypothetical protein